MTFETLLNYLRTGKHNFIRTFILEEVTILHAGDTISKHCMLHDFTVAILSSILFKKILLFFTIKRQGAYVFGGGIKAQLVQIK